MSYMVLPLNFGTPIWVHLFCCLCLGFPGEWLKSQLLPAWPVLRDGTEYPQTLLFARPRLGYWLHFWWTTGKFSSGPAEQAQPRSKVNSLQMRCAKTWPRPSTYLSLLCSSHGAIGGWARTYCCLFPWGKGWALSLMSPVCLTHS